MGVPVTTHTWHADVHACGLADDCPRCAEHAEHPLQSLDTAMVNELLRRVNLGLRPRSDNEAIAMRRLAENA